MSAQSKHSENNNSLVTKLSHCRLSIEKEYSKKHKTPWIICFSGGKDSTLLLQLVFEMMLKHPAENSREIHIVANDTLVESPLIIKHLNTQLRLIREFSQKNNLPVKVSKTTPNIDDTFWVNLIGRGYCSPNRSFRWCTDRLKIRPTNKYIKEQVNKNGKVIILLGIRRSESRNRKKIADELESTKASLFPHKSLANCMVFSPIINIEDDNLWAILLQRPPPWAKTHRNLITLYRNAKGGQCPTILDKSDAPMCGGSSARFGCWTCTVIAKDKSLEGLVDSGFEEFQPLIDFRDYLSEIRDMPKYRMKRRRNGTIGKLRDGRIYRGPFTLSAREMLLKKLEDLEQETDMKGELISKKEKDAIVKIWEEDRRNYQRASWRRG